MRSEVPAPQKCSPPIPLAPVFIRFLTQHHPGCGMLEWPLQPHGLAGATPGAAPKRMEPLQGCGTMVLVEGQDALGPGMGTPRGEWDPPLLLSVLPPGPTPGVLGVPGASSPGKWGGHPISFLPCCCTWVIVRVCYLYKELPPSQCLPLLPEVLGMLSPPTLSLCPRQQHRSRGLGQVFNGVGGHSKRTWHVQRSREGGTGASSTCRYMGAGSGGDPATPSAPPPLRGGGSLGPRASPAAPWGAPVAVGTPLIPCPGRGARGRAVSRQTPRRGLEPGDEVARSGRR